MRKNHIITLVGATGLIIALLFFLIFIGIQGNIQATIWITIMLAVILPIPILALVLTLYGHEFPGGIVLAICSLLQLVIGIYSPTQGLVNIFLPVIILGVNIFYLIVYRKITKNNGNLPNF